MKLKEMLLSAGLLSGISCTTIVGLDENLRLADYSCGDKACMEVGEEFSNSKARPLQFISGAFLRGTHDYRFDLYWNDRIYGEQMIWYEFTGMKNSASISWDFSLAPKGVEYKLVVTSGEKKDSTSWKPSDQISSFSYQMNSVNTDTRKTYEVKLSNTKKIVVQPNKQK